MFNIPRKHMRSYSLILSAIFLVKAGVSMAALLNEKLDLICCKSKSGGPVNQYVFELISGKPPVGTIKSDTPFEDIFGRIYSRFDPHYMKSYYAGQSELFVCNRSKNRDEKFIFCRNWTKQNMHAQYIQIYTDENPRSYLYDEYSGNRSGLLTKEEALTLKPVAHLGACVKPGGESTSS